MVGITVYVYIPKFYTDVVGIHIAALGTILFTVRLFDIPAIDYLSDRTQTRFGRRRPYIAIGAFWVVKSMFLLFNPPQVSAYFETWWFGICIFAGSSDGGSPLAGQWRPLP